MKANLGKLKRFIKNNRDDDFLKFSDYLPGQIEWYKMTYPEGAVEYFLATHEGHNIWTTPSFLEGVGIPKAWWRSPGSKLELEYQEDMADFLSEFEEKSLAYFLWFYGDLNILEGVDRWKRLEMRFHGFLERWRRS